MSAQTRRRLICGGSLLLFLAGMIVVTVLSFDKLTGFVKDPAAFRDTIDAYGFWGKGLFVLLMAAQVVLAVIPGHPFEIVAACVSAFSRVRCSRYSARQSVLPLTLRSRAFSAFARSRRSIRRKNCKKCSF